MTADGLPSVLSRAVRPGVCRPGPEYSVCTLVSDPAQHAAMIASFRAAGFIAPTCEFLHLDNSSGNLGDGYRGLNLLIDQAEGQHIILSHQDVRLRDGKGLLDARLAELHGRHPDWAVAGNAGFDDHRRRIVRITDRHMIDARTPGLPLEVASLDENLLILRRDALLGFSHDLSGFHLYGTDIVCQARLRGRRAFVIDFHVEHLGRGNKGTSFVECRMAMIAKYHGALRIRRVTTPSTAIVLGPGKWLQRAWLHIPEYLRTSYVGSLLQGVKQRVLAARERLHGDRYQIDGTTVVVPPETPAMIRKALRRGEYAVEERRLVATHVRSDLPVIELGGAYGVVGQCLSRVLGDNAPLIVVESDAALTDICRANAECGAPPRETHFVNANLCYGDEQPIPTSAVASTKDHSRGVAAIPAVTLTGLLRSFDIRTSYTLVCNLPGEEWNLVTHDAEALAMCETFIVRLHPGKLMDSGHQVYELIEKIESFGLRLIAREGFVLVATRQPSDMAEEGLAEPQSDHGYRS